MTDRPIYIHRGQQRFERYRGTKEDLAIIGWPSVFPERLRAPTMVSVSAARDWLFVNESLGVDLLSMDPPDEETWGALQKHR